VAELPLAPNHFANGLAAAPKEHLLQPVCEYPNRLMVRSSLTRNR